ncbi:MAG: PKD domain-containing protein, partial [Bacteroidetes bacterium]
DYYWYVDNQLVRTISNQIPSMANLVHTFTTPGMHYVRLVVDNGTCSISDTLDSICIEPRPLVNYKANNADSVAACAPLTFTTTNLTNAGNCNQFRYAFNLWDRNTNQRIVPGPTTYTLNFATGATTPTVTVHKDGNYRFIVSVTNLCGTYFDTLAVRALPKPIVQFPSNKSYCGTKTIAFGTDTLHKPIINLELNSSTYQWQVTGGAFQFVNGTNASSRFPVIQFLNATTYTVQLRYGNGCADTVATQQISFFPRPAISLNRNRDSICFDANLSTLVAQVQPSGFTNFLWTTNGTGTFTNTQDAQTNYQLSAADRAVQNIRLTFTVVPAQPNICEAVSDSILVHIFPRNFSANDARNICTQQAVGYQPISSIQNSNYTWQSAIVSGSVSGVTSNGMGIINDVLVNASTVTDAQVKYSITPLANGCSGEAFDFIATVKPKPVAGSTKPIDSICSGQPVNIQLQSSIPHTAYTWSAVATGAAVSGITQPTQPQAVAAITDMVSNTTTGTAMIVYTITPFSTPTCAGNSFTDTVFVKPGITAANAGNDVRLCAANSTQLQGNTPVMGVGTWEQVLGTPLTIQNTALPNTAISGMQANEQYSFVWRIADASSCPPSTDTVVVYNRAAVTTAAAGTDQVVCDNIASQNGSVSLQANNTNHTYETGAWQVVSRPTGALATIDSANRAITTFKFSKEGVYTLVWKIQNDASCNPSTDTVKIFVFDKPSVSGIAASNTQLCAGSNATVQLNNLAGAVQYWQVNHAPLADSIWVDTLVTNASISFTALQDSVFVKALVVSNGANMGCSTRLETNVLPISVSATTIPGKLLGTDTVCNSSNAGTITLTQHRGTITRWEFSTNNGATWQPMLNQTSASIAYSNISSTTWYRTQVKNGFCNAAYSDTARLFVRGAVTSANAGADSRLCNQNGFTLAGNSPAQNEYGVWSQIAGPNTVYFAQPQAFNTRVDSVAVGTYGFVWTLFNNACAPTRDTIFVQNFPAVNNTIDTASITKCFGEPIFIGASHAQGGSGVFQYAWQVSTNQGASWSTITGADSMQYSFSADTSKWIRRVVTSSVCSNASAVKKITVFSAIRHNSLPLQQFVCTGLQPGIIQGSVPTGADGVFAYRWEYSVDSLNWATVANASAINLQPDTLTLTTWFRRIAFSNFCATEANTSSASKVLVHQNAEADINVHQLVSCAPFSINSSVVNALSYPDRNGTHSWFVNNSLHASTVDFPLYVLQQATDSVKIGLTIQSAHGCKADSTQVTLRTFEKPVPAFTMSDSVGCGPITVSFNNQTPNAGRFTYLWDFGNGQLSNATNPAQIIFQPNVLGGDTIFYVKLKAAYECDTVVITKPVFVKGKPKVVFTPERTTGCSPFIARFTNHTAGVNNFVWYFGDGDSLVTNQNNTVTHTYYTGVQDTVLVKLKATNECGTDSSKFNLVVSPNTIRLAVIANGNQVNGCAPHTVRFVNNSNGANAFAWNFGDGTTLTTGRNLDTITHVFTQAGNYQVTVRATNACSDTTGGLSIRSLATPNASFQTPSTICVGTNVSFQNTSDTLGNPTWNFGNGSTSNLLQPQTVYNQAGTYAAQLIMSVPYNTGNVCADTATQTLTVASTLPGLFTASDTASACAPFTVQFQNISHPTAQTKWFVNNTLVQTGASFANTFTANGTYPVRMEALHPSGCTFVAEKTIDLSAPTASWQHDTGAVCSSRLVNFQAQTNATVDSVRWYFGDGNSLVTNGTTIQYTYTQTGRFTPYAVIKHGGANGCTIPLVAIDTILVNAVQASFTPMVTNACGVSTISLQNTTTSFEPIIQSRWLVDNAHSLAGTSVQQTVAGLSRTVPVRLITTALGGCTDTITQQLPVTIWNLPNAAIVVDSIACARQAVSFTPAVTSTDSIAGFQWSFGNNLFSSALQPSTHYVAAGTYTAQLVARTIHNCTDTAIKVITVKPTPVVVANADRVVCRGQSSTLHATGATNYIWSPALEITGITSATPSVLPSQSRQYIVLGYDAAGTCFASDTVNITVQQPIDVTVNRNDSICIGSNTRLTAAGAAKYSWSPVNGLSNTNSFSTVAQPNFTTTYTVTGTDEYGCFTDTANVTVAIGLPPTVDLGSDKTLATGTQLPLTTKVTNGPIRNWLWSGADLSCTTCAVPTVNVKAAGCYTVKATTAYGCTTADTLCVKVFCESAQVFIPNAFTPDGDGQNDVFMIRGSGIKMVKSVRVFNRWGQVVFERANVQPNVPSQGWDGKINGIPASTDVYIYTCEVVCENDVPYTYKGNVAIIK